MTTRINHNRSITLERSVINYWRDGGLKPVQVTLEQPSPLVLLWFINILYKINLAIVFVCVRSTISDFYCQIIASSYMRRSLEKEFTVKILRMINRIICTRVSSGSKTSGGKWHFGSYAGAKIIMKRLLSHQNREKTKHCWQKKRKY